MENSMSTGMRVFDMDGRIAYVNPAFCRMIGWNEAALIGRTAPFPYWIPNRFEHHQETLDILLSGRTPRDRKSTRLHSSHVAISDAVFCLKKKTDRRAR